MNESEIRKYQALNELAESFGTVILGGSEDKNIPLSELVQAFDLRTMLYNRSISDLSVNDAVDVYERCVADLRPEHILLHIGVSDLELFADNSSSFDNAYRELIKHIRATDKKCSIAIISLKNPDASEIINELNRHLKYIAEAERCEFGDISMNRVWNPMETKNVLSIVSSLNLTPNVSIPLYDLIKILYGSLSLS